MKLIALSVCMIAGFTFVSCNKKDSSIGTSELKGTWQEHETIGTFAGTTYRITFNADRSFTAQIKHYTDAVDTSSPCYKHPISYVKGQYSIKGNAIVFTGIFTEANFQTPHPNCEGGTDYNVSYVSALNGNELTMNVNAPNEFARINMYKEQ